MAHLKHASEILTKTPKKTLETSAKTYVISR
jgi:hypothetical protein